MCISHDLLLMASGADTHTHVHQCSRIKWFQETRHMQACCPCAPGLKNLGHFVARIISISKILIPSAAEDLGCLFWFHNFFHKALLILGQNFFIPMHLGWSGCKFTSFLLWFIYKYHWNGPCLMSEEENSKQSVLWLAICITLLLHKAKHL